MFIKRFIFISPKEKSLILDHIEELGLSVRTIASDNGISCGFIYAYLNGLRSIDSDITLILNKYGVFFDFNTLSVIVKK
jgi:hypothetical protein